MNFLNSYSNNKPIGNEIQKIRYSAKNVLNSSAAVDVSQRRAHRQKTEGQLRHYSQIQKNKSHLKMRNKRPLS